MKASVDGGRAVGTLPLGRRQYRGQIQQIQGAGVPGRVTGRPFDRIRSL